jgi:hypothetical protein
MNSPLWLNFLCLSLIVVAGIWIFLVGYRKIKTGRSTNFGPDSNFHLLDEGFKNKKSHSNDPRRTVFSGFFIIAISLTIFYSAISILIRFILPRIK